LLDRLREDSKPTVGPLAFLRELNRERLVRECRDRLLERIGPSARKSTVIERR